MGYDSRRSVFGAPIHAHLSTNLYKSKLFYHRSFFAHFYSASGFTPKQHRQHVLKNCPKGRKQMNYLAESASHLKQQRWKLFNSSGMTKESCKTPQFAHHTLLVGHSKEEGVSIASITRANTISQLLTSTKNSLRRWSAIKIYSSRWLPEICSPWRL